MPSSIAHGLAAVAVSTAFFPHERSRFYATAALGAVLPDIDAIGRPFGLGDVGWLGGHRAFTHSLLFASLLAIAAVIAVCRGANWQDRRLRAWTCFALAFALHGALDALTTYGAGVMFLAPLSMARFKAGWHPFHGIVPEIAGVWLPAVIFIWLRRRDSFGA